MYSFFMHDNSDNNHGYEYMLDFQMSWILRITAEISIKEKNTLLNNPITRGFGLFKKRKQGDSFITINNNLAQENVFRDLYDSAHKAFKFGNKGLY